MPVTVAPVASEPQPPKQADVVVIGGGIIGVCATYFLVERGISVALCEKGIIAGEQSGRNWGWCRAMGRDPRELPLIIESLQLWRRMNELVGAETGFRQNGTMYLCPDEATLAKREAWLPHARAHGLDTRMLRGAEVNSILMGSAKTWLGALYTPSDGGAEPSLATSAIATAAAQRGVRINLNCAVRGIETSAGRVSGVVTEKGTIASSTALIAGGAWSSLICRQVGAWLPLLKVVATVLRTAPVESGPTTAAWGPGLALRKRLDGGYTVSNGSVVAEIVPDSFRFFRPFLNLLRMEWKGITFRISRSFLSELGQSRKRAIDEASPFEAVRILDPAPVMADLRDARSNLENTFPRFAGVQTVESWAGAIDVTPDVLPVISPVDGIAGLYVAAGFSGHGFGIGPAAGRLIADLIVGQQPVVDPLPFRLSRFSDGAALKIEAGL
jgi:glycine/D-amino acid oxidase-like deaminating enzyme